MESLNDFYAAAADPEGYARGLKDSGRKIIGYFCTYTPEELILAAGAHPLRLFGTKGEISLADAHLQAYGCSLVRGGLEKALSGQLDFLDGTVFPHTCDTIQRLSDVWRLNTDFGFFADVVLPVKLDTESAREYLRDVLKKFRKELAAGLGVDITDQALAESLDTYGRIREALKKIYDLRAKDPGLISGSDLHAVVKGSMVMDREYLADHLPEVAESVSQGEFAWEAGDRKRLLLVGGICDHPDIFKVLETSGGVVVSDDLCTGSRWFLGTGQASDPLEALAQRYLDRPVCAAKHAGLTTRGDHMIQLAQENSVDGAIFLLLKFCDPHAFDYPYMKEMLDQAGIPNMLYEIEDQLPSEGQLATRFETFIHTL